MSDRLDEFSAWQLKQLIEAGSALVTCVGFDKLVSTASGMKRTYTDVMSGRLETDVVRGRVCVGVVNWYMPSIAGSRSVERPAPVHTTLDC